MAQAVKNYLKNLARYNDGWGIITERNIMHDTLCDKGEIDETMNELKSEGWKFDVITQVRCGVEWKIIEFEIN